MASLENQELRRRYLEKLYELSECGLHPEVDYKLVQSSLGYSDAQTRSVVDYLESKGSVSFKCRVPCIKITTQGIDEIEAAMDNQIMNRRYRVLEKIYDLSGGNTSRVVSIPQLEQETQIFHAEMNGALDYLSQKWLIDFRGGDVVYITSTGVDQIERTRTHPEMATDIFPPNITYNINIQGDNRGNIAQGGQGHNQSITNHQPISEILPKLAELIEAVKQADFEDKDEVVRDLEKAHQLAQSEDPKSKWALIQSKLTSAKTGMEIVGFGYQSLPYWPVIWQYFFG